jgi:hypothetical protein
LSSLAAGGDDKYDSDALQERAAHLFSGALTIIFFSLDCMTMLHLGMNESKNRCLAEHSKKKKRKGLFVLSLRLGLLAFVATLSQWVT